MVDISWFDVLHACISARRWSDRAGRPRPAAPRLAARNVIALFQRHGAELNFTARLHDAVAASRRRNETRPTRVRR